MKISLRTLLVLSFASLMAVSAAAILIVLHAGLEGEFKTYLQISEQVTHDQIMQELQNTVDDKGQWNEHEVASLGKKALDKGLLLRLKTPEGREIWNAMVQDPDRAKAVIQGLQNNLKTRFPFLDGSVIEQTHPIIRSDTPLGSMGVWVFGPWSMDKRDLWFLQKIDEFTLWGGFFSLIPAFGLGIFLYRTLGKPLRKLEGFSAEVALGNFDTRLIPDSRVKEILRLQESLLAMAKGLHSLEKLRQEKVSDTAHELRTPLANLYSQLEALEDGVVEPQKDRFKKMKGEIKGLTMLIEDWELLDKASEPFSLGTSQEFSMVHLAKEISESFTLRLDSKGQSLTTEGSDLMVRGYPERLRQVLINLIENAHRYSYPRTIITMSWSISESHLIIKIDDRGPGIPVEHLPFVFDRFYRVDKSRSKSSGGRGLGLPIVRAWLKAMGGTIALENKAEGGLRALVSLPL